MCWDWWYPLREQTLSIRSFEQDPDTDGYYDR